MSPPYIGCDVETMTALGDEMGSSRIYSCNDSYFKTLNEQTAYWIGFLAADGCVVAKSERNKLLQLTLQEKDKGHMELFRAHLGATYPIRYVPSTKAYSIVLASTELANDLAPFGVIPRKSWNCQFPLGALPLELMRHYIRGYVDGDGSISMWLRKTRGGRVFNFKAPDASWTVVGTTSFCTSLNSFLAEILGLSPGCITQKKGQTDHRIVQRNGFKQVVKILHYTHDGMTVALERKRVIVDDIFAAEKEKEHDKNQRIAAAQSGSTSGTGGGAPEGAKGSDLRGLEVRKVVLRGQYAGADLRPCLW